MPQSAARNEEWRSILSESAENDDQIPILLENNVHKIGNLTLTGYNSEMSARSFTDKRDYRDPNTNEETGLKTRIFLNESLTEEGQDISNKEEWTLGDIERRTNYLIEQILPIYQFS